jgi:hypothetical protein
MKLLLGGETAKYIFGNKKILMMRKKGERGEGIGIGE